MLGDCVCEQLRGALGRWCWWESCGGRTKSSTSLGAQDNQLSGLFLHGFLHSQAANKTNINDMESIITFRFGQLKSTLNTEYQDIIHITLHCTKGHHSTAGQTAPARGKESSLFPAYPAVIKKKNIKARPEVHFHCEPHSEETPAPENRDSPLNRRLFLSYV